MIREYSVVKMADNAGARTGRCIRVLGGSRKRYASIGDMIVVAVHGVAPNGPLEEGSSRQGRSRADQEGIPPSRWFLYPL